MRWIVLKLTFAETLHLRCVILALRGLLHFVKSMTDDRLCLLVVWARQVLLRYIIRVLSGIRYVLLRHVRAISASLRWYTMFRCTGLVVWNKLVTLPFVTLCGMRCALNVGHVPFCRSMCGLLCFVFTLRFLVHVKRGTWLPSFLKYVTRCTLPCVICYALTWALRFVICARLCASLLRYANT